MPLGISNNEFHNRAKYHINGRLPGFEYPYWDLPEKPPEEAEEEAVMLIGGLPSWILPVEMYRVTHLLGKNLLLTWIWDVPPSCCLGSRQLQ